MAHFHLVTSSNQKVYIIECIFTQSWTFFKNTLQVLQTPKYCLITILSPHVQSIWAVLIFFQNKSFRFLRSLRLRRSLINFVINFLRFDPMHAYQDNSFISFIIYEKGIIAITSDFLITCYERYRS